MTFVNQLTKFPRKTREILSCRLKKNLGKLLAFSVNQAHEQYSTLYLLDVRICLDH